MDNNKPSWKLRRRVVFGCLFFAMTVIVYVAFKWESTTLSETLVLSSFGLIGAVAAAYIGGAAYEDAKLFKNDDNEEEGC